MKRSEARILVLITQLPKPHRYATYISAKLGYEYSYVTRLLKGMVIKNWIRKARSQVKLKKFYAITSIGKKKLKQAKQELSKQ